MPVAQLKDYYKILELQPVATFAQIRKAYRSQALKYHPDTNAGNPYAAAHFLEIQEAYTTLIDETKRRKYDEERWLNGMSNRAKGQAVVTPAWIHTEATRLSKHIDTIDTYRMSHSALYDYVMLLLQDSYMAILQQAGNTEMNAVIVTTLLHSTRHLKWIYMQPVSHKLAQLIPAGHEAQQNIRRQERSSYRQHLWQKLMPFVIVIITLALCMLMYLYSKK